MADAPQQKLPPSVAYRIAFQPIIGLKNTDLYGYEALARFTDERSPLEHLAEARERGILTELELALISSATTECGALPEDVLVTVNASASTILDPRFPEALGDRKRLGVELAETSPTVSCSLRDRLTAIDVLLLVDDAGTDYATPDRIRALCPSIVKIDRTVFWRAAESGDATNEFAQILDATDEVGALSLAEGIETEAHERFAKDRGVTLAQGFRYGAAEFA